MNILGNTYEEYEEYADLFELEDDEPVKLWEVIGLWWMAISTIGMGIVMMVVFYG